MNNLVPERFAPGEAGEGAHSPSAFGLRAVAKSYGDVAAVRGLDLEVRPGLQEGRPAQVLVRPDDVVIDLTGRPAGVVVPRHFSGTDNVYCVELEGGGLLHCRQPGSVGIPAGSEIGLRLSSTSLPVYP